MHQIRHQAAELCLKLLLLFFMAFHDSIQLIDLRLKLSGERILMGIKIISVRLFSPMSVNQRLCTVTGQSQAFIHTAGQPEESPEYYDAFQNAINNATPPYTIRQQEQQ